MSARTFLLPAALGWCVWAFTATAAEPGPAAAPATTPATTVVAVDQVDALIADPHAPGAVTQLGELIRGSDAAGRQRIFAKLVKARCYAARPMIAGFVADPAAAVDALHALAALGYDRRETADAVVALAANAPEPVQRAALGCLVAWGDRRHLPVLIARLQAGGVVAETAHAGLMAFADVDHGRDASAWLAWYDHHFKPMEELARSHVEALSDAKPAVVVAAIQALTLFNDLRAEHADLIAPLQAAKEPAVADAAILAMRVLRPQDCVEPVVDPKHVTAVLPMAAQAAAPAMAAAPPSRPLFDTWAGVLIAASGVVFALSGTLYLLRSPTVHHMTKRYVAPALRQVSNQTGRIARKINQHVGPVMAPVTNRFLKPALRRAGEITARIAKRAEPVLKPITSRIARGTDRYIKPALQKMGKATEQLLRPTSAGQAKAEPPQPMGEAPGNGPTSGA